MADRARVEDGFSVVDSGVDSNRNPLLLPPNMAAWAINGSFRTGFISPRPGYRPVAVTWSSETAQEAFEDGKFQGAGRFILKDKTFLVASVSGRLFAFDLADNSANAFEITGADTNNPNEDYAYFAQADKYLVIQDGKSAAWIWDGVALRRADRTKKEVPTGTWMAYGNGRLWLAQGSQYIGGDLVNSDEDLGAATALRFEENTVIAEGGGFPVPSQITGFAFMPRQDTVAAVGSLLVFTADSIFEFDAPVDRTVWKSLQYPIQRYALLAFGTECGRSLAGVNGDIFFRASDGIRSFFWARRDFDTWGNTPVSAEIQRAMAGDSEALLGAVSAVNFDNRLLTCGTPQWTARGIVHRTLTSLDFDRISGISEPKQPPAWDGAWTGLDWFQVISTRVSGTTRCFGFVLSSDGAIRLWEITKGSKTDGDPIYPTPIEWTIETRRMTFGGRYEAAPKSLDVAQFWISDVNDTVLCRARYRPNGLPCWQPWHAWKECAQVTICPTNTGECQTLATALPLAFAQGAIPRPPAAYNETMCQTMTEAFDFQVRLEFRGYLVISKFMFTAEVRPPSQYGEIRAACEADCIPANWRIS